MTDDRLWKVEEVAAYLSVSRSTVYRLIRDRELQRVRIHRRAVRITGASLRRYVEARLVNDDEPEPERV